MKSKFAREIALLTLPVLILGGVALWNARVGSHAVDIGALLNTSRPGVAPKVTFRGADVIRVAPNRRVYDYQWTDCQVWGHFRLDYDAGKPRLETQMKFLFNDIVDGAGRSLLNKPGGINFSYMTRYRPTLIDPQEGPVQSRDIGQDFPLFKVSPLLGPLQFRGTVATGGVKPISFRADIRPAWWLAKAHTLKLESAREVAVDATGARIVEVKLNVIGPKMPAQPVVMNVSQVTWKVDARGKTVPGTVSWEGKSTLLPWSVGVQSADNKYDSIRALQSHMQTSIRNLQKASGAPGGVGFSFSPSEIADKFPVQARVEKIEVRGQKIRVLYSVKGVTSAISQPQLRARIYIAEDGFLSITCPLNPERKPKLSM